MRRRARLTLPGFGVVLALAMIAPACVEAADLRPDCGADEAILVLAAQAVPSATLVPCVDVLLTGWRFSGSETINGTFRFWLDSDRAGLQAVEVSLVPACDVSNAVEVTPGIDEAGTRRFEEPLSLEPAFSADRFYTFPGGCVTVRYRFDVAESTLVLEADQAIGFRPRRQLVDLVADHGLILCGAGAPECPGGE